MIRKMVVADLDKIMPMENSLYKTPWSKQMFEDELIKNKFANMYVLEKNNEIVGYIGAWMVSDNATITKVSVDKRFQGQGYSKILMDEIIKVAKDADFIFLEVRVSNIKAHNLYLSYGFKDVGIRKKYYSDGEDAIAMVRKLKGD